MTPAPPKQLLSIPNGIFRISPVSLITIITTFCTKSVISAVNIIVAIHPPVGTSIISGITTMFMLIDMFPNLVTKKQGEEDDEAATSAHGSDRSR